MKAKDIFIKKLKKDIYRYPFSFKYSECNKEDQPSLELRQNKVSSNQNLVENLSTKNRDETLKSQSESGYNRVYTFGIKEYVFFDTKSTYLTHR